MPNNPSNPDEDYYFNEQGLLVMTAKFHLKRGYCCKSGCKHCPYGFNKNSNQQNPPIANDNKQ